MPCDATTTDKIIKYNKKAKKNITKVQAHNNHNSITSCQLTVATIHSPAHTLHWDHEILRGVPVYFPSFAGTQRA